MTDDLKPRGFLRLFFRRGGFGLLFALVFAAFPAVIGLSAFEEASAFSERGQRATAELVSTAERKLSSPGSGNTGAIPTATVRFSVAGKEVFASARISPSRYETARPGESLTIRYLPEDPTQVEIESNENLTTTLILGSVAAVCLGAWLFLAYRAARYAREAIHVRNNGTRTLVEVTEHKAPLFTSDRKPETTLVWQDSSGREGRSLPLKQDAARPYRAGRQIAIYEIPGSHHDSFWEGDVGRG